MLIFEIIEDYERAVDGELAPEHVNILEIIDNMNFENYFSNVQLKSTDDDENGMDDFLGQLLNKDGVIQIGENIFRIDLINEKVFVLDIKSKEKDYSDLIAGNAANKNIQIFSTDDDVLDIIMDGVQEKACGGIGGGEYVTSVVSFGNNINCQGSVKHFRAGIYFRTTARFVPLINDVIYTELEIKGPEAWAKKRPCNSNSVIISSSGVKKSGYTQQLWEFYSGARNLNGYYLFARIKCTFNGTTKYSTWGGRNINSPY